MSTRVLLSCSLILALGATSATSTALGAAKPKPKPKPKGPPPLCKLIESPVGDTPTAVTNRNGAIKLLLDTTHQKLPYATPPGYDPALDLVSADIASNATTITVVFRLANLAGATSTAPFGRFYGFNWSWGSSGQGQNMDVVVTAQGNRTGPGTDIKTVIDVPHNEIRLSEPIGTLIGHPLMPPGERMLNLKVETDDANPTADLPATQGFMGETATSTKPYPHMAPSCVKVGA